MDTRIDPPSSMYRLTLADISKQCEFGEVWTYCDPVEACIFLREKAGRMYLGKLAVAEHLRGRGIARQLISLAEQRARLRGLRALELEVRIELLENHAAFAKLGFKKVSEGAHDGYDRATFITMRKPVVA